jgi:uncharacterized protein YoxC
MVELNDQIDKINEAIEEIRNQIAIIQEIFVDFSDSTEWDTARENNKNTKGDEVWNKRKLYRHSTLQQLVEEISQLRDEKNLLLQKEIQLNDDIKNGSDILTLLFIISIHILTFLI